MKTIFTRRFPASVKISAVFILSLALFLSADSLAPTRQYLATFFSPLQIIASAPLEALDNVSETVKSRETLMEENQALRQLELSISDRLLKLEHLEQENARLRAMLGSPVATTQRKLIARIQSVDADPFRLQVVLNKGAEDDVFVGQPVVDEHGVVGQVVEVNEFSSRVLLIADNSHAIPLRNQRNDVRLIGLGRGDVHQMELQYVTKNTDVKIGDMLVTSGLGDRFPEGYPVATVTGIENRGSEIYSTIHIRPIAQLDRIRYVLLLWPELATSDDSTEVTPQALSQ
ncbi:MAG: rod shape-determining protein MreC [Psychrobium sp.]